MLVRRAVLTALFTVLAVASASAKVPDLRFSTFDPVLYGDPQGSRAYHMVVRDVANAPISGHVATLDLSGTSLRLYDVQEAGTTANCALRTLSRFTDAAGVATFHVRFGGSCSASVLVTSEGVPLGSVPARSTDIDGVDGCVGLGDLGLFSRAFLDGSADHPELDFDGSGGRVGLGDLVLFGKDLLDGTKGSYCP